MKRSAAACLGLLLASACGGADEPRSALLVTLDTTRFDSLSSTGAPAGVSPNLDALADESVTYTAARTVAPLTMPSHASILTGLYPPRHTVRTNSRMALPRAATTLAEKARAAGMQTAAFVAAEVLSASFGLDQGFDHYAEPELRLQPPFERLGAEEIADRAIAWIRARDPDRPFLVWVHFFDPHWPYEAPERFLRQAGGDVYLAEVARADHALGRILDVLRSEGVYDDTAIVVVADHGEGLEEHDEKTHGTLAYDSTIRVPLLFRYPDGHRAGERSGELVSVVDVLPTLSEAIGLAPPGDVDGRSLYRRAVPGDRGLYFESYYGFYSFGWSHISGWVDAGGKYIHSSEPEFYEPEDAGELADAFAAREGELQRYRDGIDAVARRSRLERSEDDRAGSAMIDQLHSLGYAGTALAEGGLPHPLEPSTRPSPRARNDEHLEFKRARRLLLAGEAAEAAEICRKIVEENPLNHSAWRQLALALMQDERFEDAVEAVQQVLEHGEEWHGPHRDLGICYEKLDRPEEALESYRRAVELEPNLVEVLDRIIVLLRLTGHEDEIGRYQALKIEALERRGG